MVNRGRLKKAIAVVWCGVALFFIVFAILSLIDEAEGPSLSKKSPLAVKDDGIYWGISSKEMKKKLGEPKETGYERGSAPLFEYIYDDTLYGVKTEVRYRFVKTSFSDKLCAAEYHAYDIDYADAKKINSGVSELFLKKYVGEKGYHSDMKDDGEGEFTRTFGTGGDVAGITGKMGYGERSFYIIITYLW